MMKVWTGSGKTVKLKDTCAPMSLQGMQRALFHLAKISLAEAKQHPKNHRSDQES